MNRRPWLLAVLAALLAERRPPAALRADPPRGPLRHRLTGYACLVDQEPVPELGVVAVGIEQRGRSVGRRQRLRSPDRPASGSTVGGRSSASGTSPRRESRRRPARGRSGTSFTRQMRPREIGSRPAQTSFSCSKSLIGLLASKRLGLAHRLARATGPRGFRSSMVSHRFRHDGEHRWPSCRHGCQRCGASFRRECRAGRWRTKQASRFDPRGRLSGRDAATQRGDSQRCRTSVGSV